MRNIIVSSFITLDGVMQAPGGLGEDFKYGGWSAPYFDAWYGKEVVLHRHDSGSIYINGELGYPTGVIIANYMRAGKVKTGTVGD